MLYDSNTESYSVFEHIRWRYYWVSFLLYLSGFFELAAFYLVMGHSIVDEEAVELDHQEEILEYDDTVDEDGEYVLGEILGLELLPSDLELLLETIHEYPEDDPNLNMDISILDNKLINNFVKNFGLINPIYKVSYPQEYNIESKESNKNIGDDLHIKVQNEFINKMKNYRTTIKISEISLLFGRDKKEMTKEYTKEQVQKDYYVQCIIDRGIFSKEDFDFEMFYKDLYKDVPVSFLKKYDNQQ